MTSYPLGPVGLRTREVDWLPYPAVKDALAQFEAQGWPTFWIAETVGREAFSFASLLLAATERLVVATGIASIWGRDPLTAAAAHKTLTEAHPERFVLGLGVSHATIVEGEREQRYRSPFSAMAAYVEAMDRATYRSPSPPTPPRRLLAALGPRMLRLAAEKTDGAHPYLTTPEHTAKARAALGEGAVLAPEQLVVLETDPTVARTIARAHLGRYFELPNYRSSLRRLGFSEEDLHGGGSNRVVDALVAFGDEVAIERRIRLHRDAGADHVCVQPLRDRGEGIPFVDIGRLADALIPGPAS